MLAGRIALALVLAASSLPVVVAAAAQAPPLPAPGAERAEPLPAYPWNERASSARDFARSREGRVSWAVVTPDGRIRGSFVHRRHSSASVVKAMLMVAYLRQPSVARRPLRSPEKALIEPMITRSSNRAATRVRGIVGNAGLNRLARRARMREFSAPAGSWGTTQVSPYDQARFFWRIDSYVPPRHRAYARGLLSRIVRPQRWAVARAQPPGWDILFKGGWVPPGRVNQVALLQRGRSRVAIAVFSEGGPSFRYGRETIEGTALRLLLRINEFQP